jgi:hypothetical protein
VLTADASFGTYDVRDLSRGPGSLMQGNLALDGAWGFNGFAPLPTCCGFGTPAWDPTSIEITLDGISYPNIVANDDCSGEETDLSGFFTDWISQNPGVAQVTRNQVKGMATGTTTGTAYGGGFYEGEGTNCHWVPFVQTTAPITVFDLKVTGKNYIFVGTDANELYGNHYVLSDSSGTKSPQPPGGTCCAASSDASDTVTQSSSNPITFQFETLDQSTTVGDRKLTFEYDLSGGGTSQQMNVTARKFAYVTNNSPSNACPSGYYGTNRTYVYTVYTHPDHNAVLGTDNLSNTAVTESFSPPISCGTETGNGILNTDAQFSDDIVDCSNKPLTC